MKIKKRPDTIPVSGRYVQALRILGFTETQATVRIDDNAPNFTLRGASICRGYLNVIGAYGWDVYDVSISEV